MVKRPKPPFIPRCLCSDTLHFVLQILSPSRFFDLRFRGDNPAANAYFEKLDVFNGKIIEWKIANRTCTRQEWHTYRRHYKSNT